MRNLISSCFEKTDKTYIENLEMFEVESDNYAHSFRVPDVLHEQERIYFDFIIQSFNSSGQTPSRDLFCKMFPETKTFLEDPGIVEISLNDLRVYIFNLVDLRVNDYISKRIEELNKKVKSIGITTEIADEFQRLQKLSNRNKAKDIDIYINGRANYEELKLRPSGMETGIKDIDDKIGGMDEGTVTVIAGFTSQFKTTFAMNIAHRNAYKNNYNICYISLETKKQDIYWNLLCRHSYEGHLSKFDFVGHEKMRRCLLNQEQEDYVFDVVEKDLYSPYIIPGTGESVDRGQVIILDESDFDSFSFGEINAVLDEVDKKLNGRLDCVIVDYIQLCKFSGDGVVSNETSQINAYTAFFRRLSQNFKKVVNPDGTTSTRQLIVILLSQIRRDSWRRAVNKNGVYDITCMSDASELEKSAFRIFTTFTTEEMKTRKLAQVQILKNRSGMTMIDEPSTVFAHGEAYVFCDDDDDRMQSNYFAGSSDLGGDITDAVGDLDFGSSLDSFLA